MNEIETEVTITGNQEAKAEKQHEHSSSITQQSSSISTFLMDVKILFNYMT